MVHHLYLVLDPPKGGGGLSGTHGTATEDTIVGYYYLSLCVPYADYGFPVFKFNYPTPVPESVEFDSQSKSKDIMWKFIVMKENLFNSMNQSPYELASHLEKEASLRLKDVQSDEYHIKGICKFIEDQSSFYDYEVVKFAIEFAGTEEDKKYLQYYERDFGTYSKNFIGVCPSVFGSLEKLPSDYGRIKVTLQWSPFVTLDCVKKFHCKMAENLRSDAHLIGNYKLLQILVEKSYVTLFFTAPAEFELLFHQRGKWLLNLVHKASDAVKQLCIIPFE